MAAEDSKMVAYVRKIIVANWLDTSLIRIRVTRGVIHLQGRVQKIAARPGEEDGTEAGMRRLDDELRTLPGLRGVAFLFDNWTREASGGWRRTGQKKGRSAKSKG